MAGPIPPDDGEEILRMQRGVRDWVLRSSRQGEQGFRRVSPPVLLSLLCAAAFSPLLAVGAGITGAAAVAGIGVLSSVGSGVLTGVIAEALDRLRPHGEGRAASREDLETEIARQIQQVFAAGEAHSAELRAEIAAVLKEINAGGTALQEAFETGNERVRSAVVSVEFSHERHAPGHRELGRHRAALGCGHPASDRPADVDRPQFDGRCRVQSGRQDPGHRGRRWCGPAVGHSVSPGPPARGVRHRGPVSHPCGMEHLRSNGIIPADLPMTAARRERRYDHPER